MDENNKNELPEEFLDQDFRDTFGDGESLKMVFEEASAEAAQEQSPTDPMDEPDITWQENPEPETADQTVFWREEPELDRADQTIFWKENPALEDPIQEDYWQQAPELDTPEPEIPAQQTAEQEASGQETQTKNVPGKKGRPARKKGYGLLGIPHILVTGVWLAIVLWVGVSLGRVLWICATDVLAFGREEKVVSLTVEEMDTLDDIAQKLKKAGLIRYPELFKAYGTLTNAREDISAGTYSLNTIYDYMALVNHMSSYSSSREVVTVTIPEGYTCEQMFRLLEEKGVCKAEYLSEYAASGKLDEYWFLEGVERGSANCLEGFLFPDTYKFYLNDSAANVIEKLLDGFEYRFSDEHQAAIDTLNVKLAAMMEAEGYDGVYIESQKFDVRKVIIVASLIEEETANSDESYKIASVIYNRLTNQKDYPYLNIDATLMYVLGHKDALTAEDLNYDSPYNTNIYKGLIPGPITNPGMNSINAALNPDNTNYHYYVLDTKAEERQHHFSETYDEHVKFINKLKEGE